MASAATVGDLIAQTRRELYGMSRGIQNQLTADITAGATSLALTYDPGATVSSGVYLCIDDEIIYCWTNPDPSNNVTVQRAQLGTTAAAHTAGTVVEVSPRFPKPLIRDSLQDEIASWPPEVYATDAVTLSVAGNSLSVDLTGIPSNYYKILQVLRKPNTSTPNVFDPLSTNWRNVGFRQERNMNTSDFASGSALFLNDTLSIAYSIRVVFSRPFDLSGFATDSTSLTTGVLLEQSMVDIPPQGAVWRLLSGREVFRTALEPQGEARNATDVPVGQTIRAAASFEAYRDKRLTEEAIRLAARHPWRRTA